MVVPDETTVYIAKYQWVYASKLHQFRKIRINSIDVLGNTLCIGAWRDGQKLFSCLNGKENNKKKEMLPISTQIDRIWVMKVDPYDTQQLGSLCAWIESIL
ncbi:hypothetical protein QQP08_008855 [Theobroma cacao]|nr:hypothetical protein QQP08_007923 [Theobroma cacao]WRX16368.1 hypothetical protein QQP08_008855 [Theobroma cacao]